MEAQERVWQIMQSAHGKLRAAALEIADGSAEGVMSSELEKLAQEVMRMASVTEIVAYAVRDQA